MACVPIIACTKFLVSTKKRRIMMIPSYSHIS
uniref:Uncharacterized protein n=1 Tax=Myoviridae sp. ctPT18 TaxID=2825098 RepID=A0A8S5NVI1_9CAUD|nr:MAG TPA: hypothetical protein [Myoviridae sp. ctPT18]